MSTYFYLECLDHDPPLRAEAESGQHLYDLPQIRADVRNRDALILAWEVGWQHDHHFRRNTVTFLAAHPKCRIGIRDEYGDEHPTTGEPL